MKIMSPGSKFSIDELERDREKEVISHDHTTYNGPARTHADFYAFIETMKETWIWQGHAKF